MSRFVALILIAVPLTGNSICAAAAGQDSRRYSPTATAGADMTERRLLHWLWPAGSSKETREEAHQTGTGRRRRAGPYRVRLRRRPSTVPSGTPTVAPATPANRNHPRDGAPPTYRRAHPGTPRGPGNDSSGCVRSANSASGSWLRSPIGGHARPGQDRQDPVVEDQQPPRSPAGPAFVRSYLQACSGTPEQVDTWLGAYRRIYPAQRTAMAACVSVSD